MRIALPTRRTAEGEPAQAAAVVVPWPAVALGAIVCAMAIAFVASMLHFTRGHLSPPLDDTLIYFQYAKQAAQGDVLRYTDGAERTSGATSLLYPFLLAPGWAIGFREDALVLYGLLLNTALFGATVALTFAIARRLAGGGAAYAAAALVALNGWLGWTFFSMMESGLHATALLLALYLFLRAREQPSTTGWFVASLVVLALARPETTLIATVLGVAWGVEAYLSAGRHFERRQVLPLAAAAGASALYFVLMETLTGDGRTNTYVAQSVLADPTLSAFTKLSRVSDGFFENVRFAFAWFGPSYVSAFAFGLFLFGATSLIADDVEEGRPTFRSMLPGLAMLGILSSSLVRNPEVQFHRWPAPYETLIVIVAVHGLWTAPRYVASFRPLAWPAAGALILTSAIAGVGAIDEFGQNSADIYYQQTAAALWLRDTTPPDAIVALNDAGAIPYYSDRRVYDVVGLVTRGAADDYRQGYASAFERLERLPEDERPDVFAIYAAWLPITDPALGVLTPVARFSLARVSIAGSGEKVVYRPDYKLFNSGDEPGELPADARSWSVADSVDVADLTSEDGHGYSFRQREVGVGLSQSVETHAYADGSSRVIDGGRTVSGRERFRLHPRDPSKPYVILMRTAAPSQRRLAVTSDGLRAEVTIPASEGRWHDVLIGRGERAGESLQIEVGATDAEYVGYYYWLLQPP